MILGGRDVHSLLVHFAFYGLSAICEDAGYSDIRLSWTPGMNPQPRLDIEGADDDAIARLVHDHATQRAADDGWVRETLVVNGTDRGLMSPRVSTLSTPGMWHQLQRGRHTILDGLTAKRAVLDLRFISALGEPSYWNYYHGDKREPRQDDAASRFEMQPRNQGSEFVGTRLRKVADAVAARTVRQVHDGLTGERIVDEAGGNKADSRTATGLDAPGPVDNALVWSALWGISQMPLILKVHGAARTSGHTGSHRAGHFYVPIWRGQWQPARLRTIIVSRQLEQAAAGDEWLLSEPARLWLTARRVTAVVRFPVRVFGSANAPERRAGLGELLPVEVRS